MSKNTATYDICTHNKTGPLFLVGHSKVIVIFIWKKKTLLMVLRTAHLGVNLTKEIKLELVAV